MNEALELAKQNLEQFLNDHPHMRKNQEEIDAVLNKVPEEQRIAAIGIMTATSLLTLSKKLAELALNLETINEST